jgi:PAS domain S-box-containing protein
MTTPVTSRSGEGAADGVGWSALFSAAFTHSRNAMVLLDDQRRHVDANGAYLALVGHRREGLIGRPVYELVESGHQASRAEWAAALAKDHFTGEAELVRADGARVAVQWAASTETASGRRLVLFVALNTSRWGRRFRREPDPADPDGVVTGALTAREREVVQFVALGNTSAEIAEELRVAPDTVRTHVRNAMTKVGARSRAQLVAKALGDGLIIT